MSITTRVLSLALACGLLTGCLNSRSAPPKVVYVEVQVPADIPDELLQDCVVDMPLDGTGRELHRVASSRRLALEQCNEDKRALRAIDNKGRKAHE